jgi:hypothetical protein
MHDAGIGVSITWLSDGGVDLRLIHKSDVVAGEGTVLEVADVLPWLEWAINKNFPNANYQRAARPLPRTRRSASSCRETIPLTERGSGTAARDEPQTRFQVSEVAE